MIKILFVCLGNICRSPTAEGVFRHLLQQRGLDNKVLVDSAGTSGWHIGDPPDERTMEEALRRGVDLRPLRGRGVDCRDFEEFDYLVAMDDQNLTALGRSCPHALQGKLYRFTDFAPDLEEREVPDPYYGGARGFARVYDIVEACSQGLLKALEEDEFQGRPLLKGQRVR